MDNETLAKALGINEEREREIVSDITKRIIDRWDGKISVLLTYILNNKKYNNKEKIFASFILGISIHPDVVLIDRSSTVDNNISKDSNISYM